MALSLVMGWPNRLLRSTLIALLGILLAIGIGLVVGLIWFVAMIGGVSVLMQPMLELYETLGVESAAVQLLVTMLLVIIQASLVTVGVGLLLRTRSEPAPATQRH